MDGRTLPRAQRAWNVSKNNILSTKFNSSPSEYNFFVRINRGDELRVPFKATIFLFVGLHYIFRNFKVRRSEKNKNKN